MELFVDCLKLKSVKKGEHIVRRGDICRNMLFFVAEGKYIISNYSKMSDFYGACALTNEESLYDFSITMTTNGKIAWTTLNEV